MDRRSFFGRTAVWALGILGLSGIGGPKRWIRARVLEVEIQDMPWVLDEHGRLVPYEDEIGPGDWTTGQREIALRAARRGPGA
ncbi:MAG: hypothetical protein V3T08_09450 [Gemmatimonadota bacterium]